MKRSGIMSSITENNNNNGMKSSFVQLSPDGETYNCRSVFDLVIRSYLYNRGMTELFVCTVTDALE